MIERGENTSAPQNSERQARKVERNFDVLPTHVSGFYLLVDHGVDPDLRRSETESLFEKAVIYGITAEKLKALKKTQEETREELLALQEEYPGLRGGRDLQEGIEVQINPHTESVFDETLLDVSLGERLGEFVHKKVLITIELDPEMEDVEGFLKSVKRRLKRQGLAQEQIDQKIKVERTLRVDEKELAKLVEKGEIQLISGTWGKQITKWNLVPRQIVSNEDIERAKGEEGIHTPS